MKTLTCSFNRWITQRQFEWEVFRKAVLFLIVILLGFNASACMAVHYGAAPPDGVIYAVQPGETLRGIQAAWNNVGGARMLRKDTLFLFTWPIDNGFGFFCWDANNQLCMSKFLDLAGGKGQIASARTIGELTQRLGKLGFEQATPASLPPALRVVMQEGMAVLNAGKGVISFAVLVVPAGFMPDPAVFGEVIDG